jgi:hypothetical protein
MTYFLFKRIENSAERIGQPVKIQTNYIKIIIKIQDINWLRMVDDKALQTPVSGEQSSMRKLRLKAKGKMYFGGKSNPS